MMSKDTPDNASAPEPFLRSGTTYLPFGFSPNAIESFGSGDPSLLIAELSDDRSYERVGVDRAMAIALDMAAQGVRRGVSILDVGCSIGTIGLLLSTIGYRVTGIDSDVVAAVQEWQDPNTIAKARDTSINEQFEFINADLRDFLSTDGRQFEVVLLLSVVHHWLGGYGYTGVARFDREMVRDTLLELCSRTNRLIYLEVPIEDESKEMPPDPEGEFVFPRWFLDAGLASSVTWITSTIATNGKPRRLFRIDLT
jgi:SAM-dependent methyltransferase